MKTFQRRFWTTDRIVNLIIGVAVAALLIISVRYLRDVLLPFFVACFIAYLMQPLVDLNCKLLRVKGRVLASMLSLLDLMAAITLVVYLFMPSVTSELDELGRIVRDVSSGKVELPPIYRYTLDLVNRYCSPDMLKTMMSGDHIQTIINGGSSLIEGSLEVAMMVLGWLLTLIYLIFVLIDYGQISRGIKLIVPYKYRGVFWPVLSDVSQSMNHYFRGQGMVALCAVVFYCIGFSIVGLPLAIPMGLLVGVLYMIPYFQYVTVIPVAAICLIYSMGGQVELMPLLGKCGLVYVISQSLCDYVVTPHIMGKEMGLNPAMILLSLSVWGSLLGIIGMVIALPVTSLILTYYNRYISQPRQKSLSAEGDKEEKCDDKGEGGEA